MSEHDTHCPQCRSGPPLVVGDGFWWGAIHVCGCGWVWLDSHAPRDPANLRMLHVAEQYAAERAELRRTAERTMDAMFAQWIEQTRRMLDGGEDVGG